MTSNTQSTMAQDNLERRPLPSDIVREGRDGTVKILVGSNLIPHHVPKSLLCYHSSYFHGALTGNWTERSDGVVKLDDVDVQVFDVFVNWLFTQKLPRSMYEWTMLSFEGRVAFRTLQMKVYIFADRFIIDDLRLAIKRAIVGNDENPASPYFDTIIYAFENLRAEDSMLNYLVECHCLFYEYDFLSDEEREILDKGQLPIDFMVRCMKKYGELNKNDEEDKENTPPARFIPCDHHEHANHDERLACIATQGRQ